MFLGSAPCIYVEVGVVTFYEMPRNELQVVPQVEAVGVSVGWIKKLR